jgi:CitMHS family citrate-Mg2+:H+ or citrate-Ca2+:H+ symporter
MLPVYRRMRMRETTLLRIGIVCMGAMNLLPWSGASLRTATVLAMEGSKLWHTVLPVQFFAIVLSLGHAFLAGIQEKARGAGAKDSLTNIGERETLVEGKADSKDLARPNRFLVNILLTIAVITMLAWNRFPGYYPTMLGTVAVLFVNYGFNAAFHRKILKRHAAPALTMCITMMGAAVLMGIMTSSIGADGKVLPSSMIDLPPDAVPSVMRCLADLISAALPAALGKHLHLLLCALAVPLALTFDTDSYFYGMLPVMLGIGQAFGLDALPIAITMQILRLSATFICPMTAAVLLATGMADVTINSHIRASALYVWGCALLCLLFAMFIGLIPV